LRFFNHLREFLLRLLILVAREGFLKDKCGPRAKTFDHHCSKRFVCFLPSHFDIYEESMSPYVSVRVHSNPSSRKLVCKSNVNLFQAPRLSHVGNILPAGLHFVLDNTILLSSELSLSWNLWTCHPKQKQCGTH